MSQTGTLKELAFSQTSFIQKVEERSGGVGDPQRILGVVGGTLKGWGGGDLGGDPQWILF